MTNCHHTYQNGILLFGIYEQPDKAAPIQNFTDTSNSYHCGSSEWLKNSWQTNNSSIHRAGTALDWNTLSYSVPSTSQDTSQRRNNAHASNVTTLDDVFMPKDDTVNPEDGEMDEIGGIQKIQPDEHTTGELSKGCCESEPEGPCF